MSNAPTITAATSHPDIFTKLIDKWPSAAVATAEVNKFSGGIISGKTLSNMRSLGKPVPESILVGSKRVYPAESLANWLRDRVDGRAA